MLASTACISGSRPIECPRHNGKRRGHRPDELRKLKAKLKRVTEERDILKKAAAYFAKQSG
ncbi:hypothetical protein GmRootA79_53560 (plasmid) [Acidovorax sp. A79]